VFDQGRQSTFAEADKIGGGSRWRDLSDWR
jgi:hypothetical protein